MENLKDLGFYFHSFGHSFYRFDNIVITKIIADIWEGDDIAKKESDWARNRSVQTIRQFKTNPRVSQFIWRRKTKETFVTQTVNIHHKLTLSYRTCLSFPIVVAIREY